VIINNRAKKTVLVQILKFEKEVQVSVEPFGSADFSVDYFQNFKTGRGGQKPPKPQRDNYHIFYSDSQASKEQNKISSKLVRGHFLSWH
jgi:hypothetical protein